MTELTAVVVGCGAVGSDYDAGREDEPPLSHAGAYRAHDATKLVAGVDREPEARRRFEQRWSVPAYDEVGTALAEHGPALVSVCTPVETHLEVVRKAVAGGVKGLWVEKPLAPTRAEGAELLDAAAGIALQVNFLRRFDPLHRRVVEIASPDLVHADIRYSGTLGNFGSHAIDLFRWLAGEVSSVETLWAPGGEPLIFLGSERGPTASLSRVRPGTTEIFEAYLFTKRGLMTLTGLGEQLTTQVAAPSSLFAGVTALGPPVIDPERGLIAAMTGGVESLVSHLHSGTPLLCGGVEGLATLDVIEEVKR